MNDALAETSLISGGLLGAQMLAPKAFDLSLYLVLDAAMCGGDRQGLLRVTEAAIAGGVTMVQWRAPGWHKRLFFEAAQVLRDLCRVYAVPFIVNDHVDVALAVDADGVHVGQRDLPAREVRRLIGHEKIVGLSVSNAAEWQAVDTGVVDYLGVGPVWATATKPDAAPALGLDGVRTLLAMPGITLPTVAIGGIGLKNAEDVMRTGVDGIAVVSAICAQPSPQQAARALRDIVEKVKA